MVQSGIYTITNTVGGKIYIGSTANFRKRWNDHRSKLRRGVHDNRYLQRAWAKYDEQAFEFAVLEYLNRLDELHLAEQFWVTVYREEGKILYNFTVPGRSPMLGREHTEESRRKISEALKGRTLSEEHCRKMSETLKGRPKSEETCRKLSKANKGKHHTEETKRKLREILGGPYPAFVHQYTGEVIPAGVNFRALCREYGLDATLMRAVKTGQCHQHKGWVLQSEHFQLWLL